MECRRCGKEAAYDAEGLCIGCHKEFVPLDDDIRDVVEAMKAYYAKARRLNARDEGVSVCGVWPSGMQFGTGLLIVAKALGLSVESAKWNGSYAQVSLERDDDGWEHFQLEEPK